MRRSISLSAFQDDICRSFVLHKLTSGPTITKGITWWLSPSPRVQVQAYTLVSASRAMTASFFGRMHRQPSIIAQGQSMYIEALHNLGQDVGHVVKSRTIETLGATMALNMYEVGLLIQNHVEKVALTVIQLLNISPMTPGWITHAGGVGRLIQLRGPKDHQKYPEKTILLESRRLIVCPTKSLHPLVLRRSDRSASRSQTVYFPVKEPSLTSRCGRLSRGRVAWRQRQPWITWSTY